MKQIQKVAVVLLMSIILTGCAGKPYNEGIESLESGDYSTAAELFQKSIDKKWNLADSYRGLGIACWEQQDYEGALAAFESALSEGTEETGSLFSLLGNCALNLKEYEKAIDYYAQGLVKEDASEELVQDMEFNMIAAYEGMGDFERAKEKLAAYVEKYPEDEAAVKEAEFLESR